MARHRDGQSSAGEGDVRRSAENYTARGWAVIPLGAGKKKPVRKGLPKRRLARKEIERYFTTASNIGLRCGEPSGGLVDIDGDAPEAVALFAAFMPRTQMVHGRHGNPGSHWWYRCPTPPKTEKFCEPRGKVLVEIRSTNVHTTVPPSLHSSGERLHWESDGEPREIDGADLRRAVAKVAAGALLVRRWPAKGRRHDAALALGGFLLRLGMPEQEAEQFVEIVARAAGDEEAQSRRRDVETTASRLSAGEAATGLPTLAQLLGRDGDQIILLLEKWLGLTRELKPAGPPPDGIDTTNHHLPTMAERAWEKLRAANQPPTVFRYGNNLVRLDAGDPEAGPQIEVLTRDGFCHYLARLTRFFRLRRNEYVDAFPPSPLIRDMLVEPAPSVPLLRRIVQVPVFSPSGELDTAPGYQVRTGVYYAPPPGFAIPAIPDRPTQEQIRAARVLILEELLHDFPFVDQAGCAHAVAALLLPFARSLINGPTPLHLIEKPTPGTGGTLLAEVLSLPALGRPAPTMTEGPHDDEWRKRLTAKLLEGPAIVLIDNIRERLQSGALASVLTTTTWEDRILGETKMGRMPVHALFLATGNNPSLSDEIARRSVRIRLDARTERPSERRDFRHPDLKRWAREHRPDLVWAACVLIQAWLAAGRPAADVTMGMYESWAQTMGGILENAGIPGLLANRQEFIEASAADSRLWHLFVQAWWREFGRRPVAVSDLYELIRRESLPFDLRGGNEQGRRTSLGMLMAQQRDRRYGNFVIRSAGERQNARNWKLVEIEETNEGSSSRNRRRR